LKFQWPVQHRRVWSVGTVLLGTAALVWGITLAIEAGIHQQIGQDFHVFWQAGRNFAGGAPLYHDYLPGARQFKYPPFAAFVFQLLALFPLPTAAVLFSLLNLILWGAAVHLTRDIINRTLPRRNAGLLPLLLAVALSARFFLDNLHHVQVNALILVLVLLGVQAFLRGKDLQASAYIVAATAIKITPIFFVAWLVARGRRPAWVAVGAGVALAIALPLVFRGPALGLAELKEYYHSFLETHQHADVSSYTAGQNLAALVGRMTSHAGTQQVNSYAYVKLPRAVAHLVYQLTWGAVLLVFLGALLHLAIRRAPVSPFEVSMVFLASLLLSPITFTTHLVSLIFVFYTFLSIPFTTLSPRKRALGGLLGMGIAASGLSGRDIVGANLYHGAAGYSIMAWTMLLLLGVMVALSSRASLGQQAEEIPCLTP
jgi:alpha-1,2-mannosyltransferase